MKKIIIVNCGTKRFTEVAEEVSAFVDMTCYLFIY